MKRKLANIAVALITFGVGVAIVSLAYSRLRGVQEVEIPQQPLLRPVLCVEEQTPEEFSAFWSEFRRALEHEDKGKLFSMTRKCSFDWEPFSGPALLKPLEINSGYVPAPLEPPFGVNPTSISGWGLDLRFGTSENFLANYDIIFSENLRQR